MTQRLQTCPNTSQFGQDMLQNEDILCFKSHLQSTNALITCLLQTPPADLLGLALVRQSTPAPGAWFPTDAPLEQVKQAAVEFLNYGNRCRAAAHTLTALRPVPLSVSCLEFGL